MTTEFLPLIQPAPAPGDSDRPSCAELTSATGERLPLKAISVETAIVGLGALNLLPSKIPGIKEQVNRNIETRKRGFPFNLSYAFKMV